VPNLTNHDPGDIKFLSICESNKVAQTGGKAPPSFALTTIANMIVSPSIALALKLVFVTSLTDPIAAVETPHLRHHHSHHSSSDNNDHNYDNNPSFDFYVYSMTYQPEFCRESSSKYTGCHHPQPTWESQLTIHGLWPQRLDGSWPSSCTAEPLHSSFYQSPDGNASRSILNDLEMKWPNVKADPNTSGHAQFWEHEWSKHGTCSGLVQFDYFNSALHLLLETPSVVKEGYRVGYVDKKELLDGYGGELKTALVCKSGYLSEVRACFEKMEDGMPGERMDCPEKVLEEGSCEEDRVGIASFVDGVDIAASVE
jgi:ribonuclease T2